MLDITRYKLEKYSVIFAVLLLIFGLLMSGVTKVQSDSVTRINNQDARNFANSVNFFLKDNSEFVGSNWQKGDENNGRVFSCDFAINEAGSNLFNSPEQLAIINRVADANEFDLSDTNNIMCLLDAKNPEFFMFAFNTSKDDVPDWKCVSKNRLNNVALTSAQLSTAFFREGFECPEDLL